VNAPFRYAHTPATGGAHEARFHAKSSKVDLALGITFGRSFAGFTGTGTVEVVPAGVRIVARRYRYAIHIAAGVVAGLAATLFFLLVVATGKTSASNHADMYKGAAFWCLMAGLLGSWIASASVRLTAPVTEVLDRTRIQHFQMIGPRIRIFAADGDVELWIPKPEGMQSMVHALATLGIPMR